MDETEPPSEQPFRLYVLLTIAFGLTNSLTSPVLPELELQAHTTAAGIGAFFVCRGIGSMCGAYLSGAVLDTIRDPHRVLALLIFIQMCAKVCMPNASSLALLGLNIGIVAASGNGIQTVTGTSLSWTYGKNMGAKANFQNAVFGLGGTLAPLLAGAFVAGGYRATCGYYFLAGMDGLLALVTPFVTAAPNPNLKTAVAPDSGNKPLLNASDKEAADLDNKVDWYAVALTCGLVACSGICEASLIFWCYSYATVHLGFEPHAARCLNSAFWAAYTGMRLLCGFLLERGVGSAQICVFSVVTSLIMTTMLAVPPSVAGQWLPATAMVGAGLGVAGLYANSVTLLRQVSGISGKSMGMIRVCSAMGNMSGASCVGFFHDFLGAYALPGVASTGIVIEIIFLILMIRLQR